MNLLPTFLAAAEAPAHGLGYLLGVLGAAIVLLLVMILGLRLQAFIALIIASIFVAIAAGMPLGDIPDTIVKGMGGALGFIATIIGLGAIFGQILENSGGAKTLANSLSSVNSGPPGRCSSPDSSSPFPSSSTSASSS